MTDMERTIVMYVIDHLKSEKLMISNLIILARRHDGQLRDQIVNNLEKCSAKNDGIIKNFESLLNGQALYPKMWYNKAMNKPEIKSIEIEKPDIKLSSGSSRTSSGKLYNTHTLFNKHQLYHNGQAGDMKPSLKLVEA